MKRDMDLVRDILLAVEAAPVRLRSDFLLEGVERDIQAEHVRLLMEAGYLGERLVDSGRISWGFYLTWDGHEFLETIRDPKIWSETKSGAKELGSWSIGLLGELAKGAIRHKASELGLLLG